MDKELINQFINKSIIEEKAIVIRYFNLMENKESFEFLKEHEEKIEFLERLEEKFDDTLYLKTCKCFRISNIFLVDVLEVGYTWPQ